MESAAIEVMFKKKGLHECGNYLGILLGTHAGNVVVQVATIRRSAYSEWKDSSTPQYGLQPRQSPVDVVHVMHRLQELTKKKNLSLYVCFIDPRKVYDSVDCFLLRKVLE